MKKQYINPMTHFFEMQMQHHVLAGSGIVKDEETGDITNVGVSGESYTGGGIKSRQGSLWDDED